MKRPKFGFDNISDIQIQVLVDLANDFYSKISLGSLNEALAVFQA